MSEILYSRYEDGARQIRVCSDGWEIVDLPKKFTTVKSLLGELTGHPAGRHWSFDRYFRLGPKHGEVQYFGQGNLEELYPLLNTSQALSIPVSSAPVIKTSRFAGIDLQRRAGEVRKLLFAGFGRKMFSQGYDPEDVLQEVYKGILVRNAGKCPWDPSKSSFGHYVHMVCSCILSNYHRKYKRIRGVEQIGLVSSGSHTEGRVVKDVSSNTTVPARPTTEFMTSQMAECAVDLQAHLERDPDASMASQVLQMVLGGMTNRADIALTLGVSTASVNKAFTLLRKHATSWKTT